MANDLEPSVTRALTIHSLFDRLLAQGGSDLHLAPGYPPMMRIRGDLVPTPGEPELDVGAVQRLLDSVTTAEQRAHFAATGDLDFAYAYGDKARFRGNCRC